MINCSLGDDGVFSYEDTCSFTCNTGYDLTGSDRICQSDGSWSGSDAVCSRGGYILNTITVNVCLIPYHGNIYTMRVWVFLLVSCSSLSKPNNGMISCSLGDDGVPSHEDTCSFICNTGYKLIGSDTRICQSNGSWSGSDAMCNRGE